MYFITLSICMPNYNTFNQNILRYFLDDRRIGEKPGTRHKATLAVERLLDGEGEELTRKAIELAKDGDLTALKLGLDG